MTRDETQAEINGLKNLLAQQDDAALEAIDTLAANAAECTNILKLPQLIFDTLAAFRETAENRIALRAKLRGLITDLDEATE